MFNNINYKEVSPYFAYDYTTGKIYWKKKTKNTKIGDEAGFINNYGYRIIKLKRKRMTAGRLAWIMFYGKDSKKIIDHKNGNRLDNRIENLREANYSQNNANSKVKSHNKLGVKGVRKTGNIYQARVTKNGVLHTVSGFKTIKEASKARADMHKELFGEFGN